MRLRITLLPALLLASLLVACSNSYGNSSEKQNSGAGQNAVTGAADETSGNLTLGDRTFNQHATVDVTGKESVDLEADSFYFDPTFIRGTPGQKITLDVENDSGTLHNFSLDSEGVDVDIQPDGDAEVDVTIPESGVLLFYCKYHTSRGMNGELLAGQATPAAAD